MRTLLVTLLVGFVLVLPGSGAAHADTCDLPDYPSVGHNGDYDNYEVTVKRMSCAKGYEVMAAHYACRIKNGPAGRCVKKVMGYGCNEVRYTPSGDANYTSWVTCAKNRKKVIFHYWQNSTVVRASRAERATSCAAPAYPATDGGFNPDVKASHLSCAKAAKIMLGHYTCRTEAGPEGRCVHRFQGYACQEERYSDFYAPDYQATVTCKHDRKKVVFGYSQTKYA